MIPPLDEHGYLPPGVHVATLDELAARFGVGSEQREAIAQSLFWLMPSCGSARILKVLLNGSFVTDREEPNDVGCALLGGPLYNESSPAAQRLSQGLPFNEPRVVNADDYGFDATTVFCLDRDLRPKGVVEVLI